MLLRRVCFLFFIFYLFNVTKAQMAHDAIYMPKKSACIAIVYENVSWKNYWESSLKRENLNVGTHTTQSLLAMATVGIRDNINVIVSVPYISTKTNAGNLMGQQGIQDLSIWGKYKFLETSKSIDFHLALGASIPLTNYVSEFMPMSIGLQCKTATARLMVDYNHASGAYVTARASYIVRSNVKIDKDAYQAFGTVYYTNEVSVPNAMDMALRAGYYKNDIQAEAFVEYFSCVNGDNIRRNDMPFLTNKMANTNVGVYGKYQYHNFGINARTAYTIQGLNVGQSVYYSLGLLYQIDFEYNKKNK